MTDQDLTTRMAELATALMEHQLSGPRTTLEAFTSYMEGKTTVEDVIAAVKDFPEDHVGEALLQFWCNFDKEGAKAWMNDQLAIAAREQAEFRANNPS